MPTSEIRGGTLVRYATQYHRTQYRGVQRYQIQQCLLDYVQAGSKADRVCIYHQPAGSETTPNTNSLISETLPSPGLCQARVCGVWCVVCGVWCVVRGVWCVVRVPSGVV